MSNAKPSVLIEMGTLKGFPSPPATLRSRQSRRLAPHAIVLGLLAIGDGASAAPRESPQIPWCPTNHRRRSRGLTMVEVEHSAEARPADNLALRPIPRADRPLDQLPAQPLMEPLGMVVRHELFHDVP